MNNCPWCDGDDPLFVEASGWRNNQQHVECPDCGMRGPACDTEEAALRIWNAIRIDKPLTD